MKSVPSSRIRLLNDAPARDDGKFLLYWMVASRRTRFNFGLQQAVDRRERRHRVGDQQQETDGFQAANGHHDSLVGVAVVQANTDAVPATSIQIPGFTPPQERKLATVSPQPAITGVPAVSPQ